MALCAAFISRRGGSFAAIRFTQADMTLLDSKGRADSRLK
jgi:hypothetical protein